MGVKVRGAATPGCVVRARRRLGEGAAAGQAAVGLKSLASNSGQHSVRGGIQTPGNACVCTRRGVPCVVRDGVRARRLFFEAFKLNGSGQAFADVDRFRLGVHDVADRGGGGDQEKESERGEGHRCTRLDLVTWLLWLVDFEIGIGT